MCFIHAMRFLLVRLVRVFDSYAKMRFFYGKICMVICFLCAMQFLLVRFVRCVRFICKNVILTRKICTASRLIHFVQLVTVHVDGTGQDIPSCRAVFGWRLHPPDPSASPDPTGPSSGGFQTRPASSGLFPATDFALHEPVAQELQLRGMENERKRPPLVIGQGVELVTAKKRGVDAGVEPGGFNGKDGSPRALVI